MTSDINTIAGMIPLWINQEMLHARTKHSNMRRPPKVASALSEGLHPGSEAHGDFYNYLGRVTHAQQLPIEGNLRLTQAFGKFLNVSVALASVLSAETQGYEGYEVAYSLDVAPGIQRLVPHFDAGETVVEDFGVTVDSYLEKIQDRLAENDLVTAEAKTRDLIKAQMITYAGIVAVTGVWAQPGLPSGTVEPWDCYGHII